MTRQTILIGDDDGIIKPCMSHLLVLCSIKTVNQLIALSLLNFYEHEGKKSLQRLDNHNKKIILTDFHELSLWSKEKEKRRRTYFRYSLSNAQARVIDMLCKGVCDADILSEINDICDMCKNIPNNRNGWKRFSLINEKELNLMRDKIAEAKLKRRMSEKDVKFLGYDEIRKIKFSETKHL